MDEHKSSGSATRDLVWLLVIMAGLWFFWLATGGLERSEEEPKSPFINLPETQSTDRPAEFHRPDSLAESYSNNRAKLNYPSESRSQLPYGGHIRLLRGNARNEYVPSQEYVVIENSRSNDQTVNITGWILVNGTQRRAQPTVVLIPNAAQLFSRQQASLTLGPVNLNPGARAIIATGGAPNSNRWPTRLSFRVNKCSGYLARDLRDLEITPSLFRSCPAAEDEPGVNNLPDACYNFVNRYPACQTAEFSRDREGYELLNNRRYELGANCRLYIQDHFSYDRCLTWHQLDEDFYSAEWRVYLDRYSELWAENREAIRLYDQYGQLIDEITY